MESKGLSVLCGALIAGLGVSTVQAGFGDFFKSLNPSAAKYETFDGKYLDKVKADAVKLSVIVDDADDVNRMLEVSPVAAGGQVITGTDLVRFHADSLLGNKKLNVYLEGIIDRLLTNTPWQEKKWQVFVSVNRSHNALTYPDATVVLTLPLLLDIESEDELAMVLAHEVSHVILTHHGSDWFVDSQKRLVAASETSLLMAEQLAKQVPAKNVDFSNAEQKLRALALIKDVSTDLLYPDWQRGQEEEADLLGMDLMIRAGYSPDEVFVLFEKQQQAAEVVVEEDKSKKEREAALNQQIKQITTSGGGFRDLFTGLGDILLTSLEALREKLKRSHPEYDKRLEFLANYREREYTELESPEPLTKSWQDLGRKQPLKGLFSEHQLAFEAGHLMGTGDVAGAASLVYKLQKGKHRGEPYIHQVSAMLRSKQGQRREAKGYLEQAVQDKRAGYPIYDDLANLLGDAGHPKEAVRVLREASRHFANLPHLRMSLIYWTNQAGNYERASQLAQDCRVAYPDYGQDCAKKLEAPVMQRTAIDLGPSKPARRLSRSEVQKLQVVLNRLGYAVGKPDGVPGRKTGEAVRRFQSDAKLAVTGQFDETTVARLNKLNPGI